MPPGCTSRTSRRSPARRRPRKPPNYKGKTKVADTKNVGGYSLILRLPKQCVQSQQKFFAGVGARKRKALAKKLGGKVKLKQVVFIYDGKKLKVKKKKPFRYLIDPGRDARQEHPRGEGEGDGHPHQKGHLEEGQAHPEGDDQRLLTPAPPSGGSGGAW